MLLKAERPSWFVNGPTDLLARHHAGKDDVYTDFGNCTGSSLFLAMLTPERFGIYDTDSIDRAFREDCRKSMIDKLSYISPAKQKSGRGINNRRCNIIEGLLNHFNSSWQYTQHFALQRAWEIMYRGVLFADPNDELTHEEQIRGAITTLFPLDNDDLWESEERRIRGKSVSSNKD